MIDARSNELPAGLLQVLAKAKRLEWLTIGYLVVDIVLLYLLLGGSQAARTAWIESFLELIPPIVFLASTRYFNHPPTRRFPYGLHRITSIAYLIASTALLVVGAVLMYESVATLIRAQPSELGTVNLFGLEIWKGWLLIAVMCDSVAAVFLGRAKREPAEQLHDKVLAADADMNRADWLTGAAAIVGILGIGVGLWWLDPVAAGFIAFTVLADGYRNGRSAVFDLMDMAPTEVGSDKEDPLLGEVRATLEQMPWVEEISLRAREEGRVYFFEVQVVPRETDNLLSRIEEARRELQSLDWRVFSVAMTPVRSVRRPGQPPDEVPDEPGIDTEPATGD